MVVVLVGVIIFGKNCAGVGVINSGKKIVLGLWLELLIVGILSWGWGAFFLEKNYFVDVLVVFTFQILWLWLGLW